METETELNRKIMELTMKIWDKHSELSKFLTEMPITIPNEKHPKINIEILKGYYESLENIVKHFSDNLPPHPNPDSNNSGDGES